MPRSSQAPDSSAYLAGQKAESEICALRLGLAIKLGLLATAVLDPVGRDSIARRSRFNVHAPKLHHGHSRASNLSLCLVQRSNPLRGLSSSTWRPFR